MINTRRTIHPGFFTAIWLLPLLALLQTGVIPRLSIGSAVAGIVLIAVVDWGILRGPDEGMLWGFIGGLSLDVFTGWPFGTNTVAMVLVASAVSLGGATFIRTHALLAPGTVFVATILYFLVVMFILQSTQHPVAWLVALRSGVLPAALLNAVLNVPIFWLFRRLEARIYPIQRANW